jgi:predicted ATP-grasp superfamily ATP-dependent carboligase
VGAIVVGGDFNGLGVVRSLGRQGVPVCIIDDEHSISHYSHYARQAVAVPDLRHEGRSIEAVLQIGQRLGLHRWVLFPTRDETVAAFSRHRSDLEHFFRVPTPGWEVIKWAWDKRKTYRLALELGIPTPRTWYPNHEDDLKQIPTDKPLAVKPAIKEHFIYATRVKAWRADNATELGERFAQAARLVQPGEVMVQELVPGDGRHQFAYCAFFKDGRPVGSMVVRRRRQHPPEFGRASTFVETVDPVPAIEAASERFLRKIGYYGLIEMEYKLDERDNQFKLLDVNARTWGYHSLGARAGVDFPYMLFADQMGYPVQPVRADTGVRWIRLVTDLPTGVLELLAGRVHLGEYLRSLTTAHIESVFCREDPLPGLFEIALIPYLAVKRGY